MEALHAMIASVFGLPADAFAPDATLRDLEAWDSLTHMTLIVKIENDYGVELTPDEIVAMTSTATIARVLTARGKALA